MLTSRGGRLLTSEIEIEVPFHDSDPMGVTWHGCYLRYLETARSALLNKIGYNVRQMTASGYLWPIVEMHIKYVKTTTFGQRPKKTGWFLATIATVSAFGFWIERNVLIWPSLVPGDTWAFLGLVQIGTALGFLGLFALTFLVFTRLFPSLAVPKR